MNLHQRAGPRHARLRLCVAPVPLRAFDTEPCPSLDGISEGGSEEQALRLAPNIKRGLTDHANQAGLRDY